MDRRQFLLRRRMQYMGILFAVFLLLFGIFDLIVYTRTHSALYEDLDRQLTEAGETIRAHPDSAVESFLRGDNIVYLDDARESYVVSYRIFLLVRSASGAILNAEHLLSFDYMLNIGFSPSDSGGLRTERAERNRFTLFYRTCTEDVTTASGEHYYIQLVTDSTEVETSLAIILRVLLTCTAVAMLLVLAAGWYLSKSLVRGVAEAWEKQDEFISYASHEIRSPLAVIHSSLELLLETPGQKIIERSDLILNSLSESSRLRKMSSNLLEMVRLQASEVQLHREELALDSLVESFIEPFVYQAEAADKRLSYTLPPGILLFADRQLVTEMLVILLENALKYTEAGDSIHLRAWQEGGNALIEVSDTGTGISDEAMKRIFTRFYREERQRSRAEGSGLGLYIASLIIEQHGGKISVRHNSPRGSVFAAVLPAKAPREPRHSG